MTAYDDAARLTLGLVARRNPIQPGVIAADLGTSNGTPMVLLAGGGERRRAAYLAPHAIQVGGAIFWERQGAALDAPPVVPLTNYQVTPRTLGGGASSGSGLGYGPDAASGGTVTPRTDWATAMTDPTNGDGSLLPMTLGEVSR